MYKDIDLRRETTRNRVRRYRNKQKALHKEVGVTPVNVEPKKVVIIGGVRYERDE